MKWSSKRGPRTQSQKGCRVFVGLLLAVMLAFGSFMLAPVPVARAAVTTTDISVPVMMMGYISGTTYDFAWEIGSDQGYFYSAEGDYRVGGQIFIDGIQCSNLTTVYLGDATNTNTRVQGLRGVWYNHAGFVDGQVHTVSWTQGNYNLWDHTRTWLAGSFTTRFANNVSWQSASSFGFVSPVTVSITGPSSIVAGVGGDWSAAGAGGTAPYTYAWTYGAIGPFFTYPHSGATFSEDLGVGSWTIECQVTDALGATATADKTVVSATDEVGYSMKFARSGTYGQYVTVIVYGANGLVSPIASTSGTQLGLSDVNGSFGWYDALAEASWINLYWRWTLQFTVGGAVSFPPVDFWLRSSITLTNSTVLTFSHHFTNTGEVWTGYDTDTGDPINPELPPAPETVLPVWLQALVDAIKGVLQWLFVPSQSQMNALLPSGTLGASLLEGTTWGTGSSTWNLHVHWGTNEITLVNMNFATVAGYGFVTAIRYAIQAGISLGLVYMVVILI